MRAVEALPTRRKMNPPPPPPSRQQLSWWRNRLALKRLSYAIMMLWIAVMLGVGFWFVHSGRVTALIERTEDRLAELSVRMGLSLQSTFLEGKNYTKRDAIIKALGVSNGQPLLTIQLADIKKRLEKLDWVKSAIVERRLPNTLHILIVERNPIAMWQNAGQIYLVDDEGSLIIEENLDPFKKDLVIMIGSDAPLYANQLLSLLKQDMELYKHVDSATRRGERRWDLRFREGIEVKLPEEHPEKAWQALGNLFRGRKLFNKNIRAIDLRVAGKMFVSYKQVASN